MALQKRVIRSTETKRYLMASGEWSEIIGDGKHFEDVEDVLSTVRNSKLEHVELVMWFGPNCEEISLPL